MLMGVGNNSNKKTLPASDDLQPYPTPPTQPLTQHGAAIGGEMALGFSACG